MDVYVRKAHTFKFHPSPWFNGITGRWKKCSRCCLVILERFLSLRLDFSLSSLWNPLAIATEEKRLFPWLTFAGSGGRATHSMAIRVLFLALILLASPFLQVARCQSDSDEGTEMVEGGGDLGIVGEDDQDFGDGNFSPAPGVDTVCVFPKNTARLVPAGEETDLLVGVNNEGESSVNVIAIKASVHLPFDHKLLVQNLTAQAFNNASVPASAQATFPYIFAVSKYLQPGTFDLVGTIIYEIDQQPYQNTFYNGTIEVVEADGFLSIESVFLVTLGIALLGLCGLWVYGQIQHLSKKTKRAPKVEVGTGTTDASMDEWLQGTAYAQSLSKSKKKK